MVLNAAVQMIREAEELKQSILKFKSDTSMLQERNLWSTQQQLQKIYQKVLVLDLDYALDKKVEQDLWNVGFKQQIEALQNISKDRKNPLRSEGQAMLSWVLQAAAGFYLCLLHQICTAFKLDLPFRRRASLLGWVEGWSPGAAAAGARLPPPAAARYICQHCLVHLGDLARYRQQPRVAYTFYRHALVVSTHSGQPYNQLGLLARRRGRRLGALYWHVRAVLVRAPFPPAPNNLLRTLQQHASHAVAAPVLPGMRRAAAAPAPPAPRLDAHSHVTELIRALYMIHTLENLEFAATLVDTLNTSLTSLVATDCFEAMTLIKMVCVIIWLVHSSTEGLTVSAGSLSAAEAAAAALSQALAAGSLLALLLPAHTADAPPPRALPALKVFLQWVTLHPQLLRSPPFAARPQLWHALAHTLNKLRCDADDKYETVPLPEDEELHGFQPLEQSFRDLKFLNHATWDTYGRRVPDVAARDADEAAAPASVVSPACLSDDPCLEAAVRAHRLVELGKRLAELRPEQFTYTSTEDVTVSFSALCLGGEELSLALAELQASAAPAGGDSELDSEDEAPLPPPIVISEADFREKVREKRVGILKPQGSLERAREERALASTDDQLLDVSGGYLMDGDRQDSRRPRVNIAMAAILRKQEETCKQVKFRTSPTQNPDSTAENATSQSEDTGTEPPKVTQHKSLSNIPVGRKTGGGILSLKDKSGYPHLVNVEEPNQKKKEEQRDPKVIQPPSNMPKRDGSQPKWHQPYEVRPHHRNYGLTNALRYKPGTYDPPATITSQSQGGIRLPVVNPKEIDVRSAALQRQSGRIDYPQRSYPIGGDKKSFLEDLPPRFANQRWNQQAETENKFREENPGNQMTTNVFNTPPPNWLNGPPLTMPPQLPLQSQLASQLHPQHPLQLSMPHPPPLDQYPPQSWWSRSPYDAPPPRTDALGVMQQIYNSQQTNNLLMNVQHSQMQSMGVASAPSTQPGYMRQSPIGQSLMPRHVSPPSFNPYPVSALTYQSLYDYQPQYQSRDYLDEVRYQPPMQPVQEVGLDLTIRKPKPDYAPYNPRRLEDVMDEALRSGSPLHPSPRCEEPEVRDNVESESPPAEPDPGTYSLFSAAPGACDWGPMAQGQQDPWPPDSVVRYGRRPYE